MEPLGEQALPLTGDHQNSLLSIQYHVFNCALCLGTLVLRDPSNVMAGFVLSQIDAAISLFTSLLQHGARTPRYKRNLQWLLNLRTRALSKTSKASATTTQPEGDGASSSQRVAGPDRQDGGGDGDGEAHRDQEEDVELLGWRTRLIERAGQGRGKTVRTIPIAAETPTGSQITDMAMPSNSLPAVTLDSTNDIVRRLEKSNSLMIGTNVPPSYGTFGTRCSYRMFLDLLAIIQM